MQQDVQDGIEVQGRSDGLVDLAQRSDSLQIALRLLFGLLAVSDVAQDDGGDGLAILHQFGYRGLGRKLCAISAPSEHFTPLTHSFGSLGRGGKGVDVPAVRLREARRQEHIQRLAQRFLGGVTKDLFRALIEEDDALVFIDGDNAIGGDFDYARETRLGGPAGLLRPLALGYVSEGYDRTGDLPPFQDRGAHIIYRKARPVFAPEYVLSHSTDRSVLKGRIYRALLRRVRRLVRLRMVQKLVHSAVNQFLNLIAEHFRCRGVHKCGLSVRVHAIDALACGVEDQFGTGEGRLVKAPGDDAPDGRPQHEEGMDARPGPWRVQGRRVIVDFFGP